MAKPERCCNGFICRGSERIGPISQNTMGRKMLLSYIRPYAYLCCHVNIFPLDYRMWTSWAPVCEVTSNTQTRQGGQAPIITSIVVWESGPLPSPSSAPSRYLCPQVGVYLLLKLLYVTHTERAVVGRLLCATFDINSSFGCYICFYFDMVFVSNFQDEVTYTFCCE